MTRLLLVLLQVLTWLLIARVILSWVNPRPRNELLLMIIRITEPILAPLRVLVPIPGVDLSPILALLLIQLIRRLLIGS